MFLLPLRKDENLRAGDQMADGKDADGKPGALSVPSSSGVTSQSEHQPSSLRPPADEEEPAGVKVVAMETFSPSNYNHNAAVFRLFGTLVKTRKSAPEICSSFQDHVRPEPATISSCWLYPALRGEAGLVPEL